MTLPDSSPAPAPRAAFAAALLGFGALSVWLVWLAHSAGQGGSGHTFRFAPWPIVSFMAIAVSWVRLTAAPSPREPERAHGHFVPAPGVFVVLAVLVAYVSTLTLEFLDPEDWYHLILVRQPTRLGSATALHDAWSYLSGHPGMLIRSLHLAVWAVEDAVFRGWAPGYRLVHLAIHGTTALLLGHLARRLGLSRAAALVAALAFAVGVAARPLLRDPTGLPELTLGPLYVGAVLLWLPSRRRAPGLVRWGVLLLLVFTRDLAFTLPVVIGALALGLDLDATTETSRSPGERIAGAVRAALPALVVPLLQGSLVLGELLLDPTSGRPRPGHPWGEFGLFAEGLAPSQIAAAFLRDLPRNLLLPVWDKEPAARWASHIVVGTVCWLAIALFAGRRHRGVAAAALAWTVVPMAMVFPFTSWEGPESGHLLYLSSAGLALFVASAWDGIPRRMARHASTLGLVAALCASFAFHLGRAAVEREESRHAATTNAWIDAIERSEPSPRVVVLLGGTEPGMDRWKRALLARYARHHEWRHAYMIVKAAVSTTADPRSGLVPEIAVVGFDAFGEILRWHPGGMPTPTGLATTATMPAACAPLRIGSATLPLCATEPGTSFDSLRAVLLSM